MIVNINDKQLKYEKDYKDNKNLRTKFDELAQSTFGISFENWYQKGYWKERYIPYSLFDDDKIISNVSVNVIEFNLLGQQKTFVQIGTVMTDENHQKLGYSKFLMEKVMLEWEKKCDLMYLFANEEVLEFYPKFGFAKAYEHQYVKDIKSKQNNSKVIKLDMSDEKNEKFLFETIKNSCSQSKLAMTKNASLIMFYCISFMKDQLYYIENLDAIIVADITKDTIYLSDIFSSKEVDIDQVLYALANEDDKHIEIGITPLVTDSFESKKLDNDESTLFIIGNDSKMFNENRLMFPVLSHA